MTAVKASTGQSYKDLFVHARDRTDQTETNWGVFTANGHLFVPSPAAHSDDATLSSMGGLFSFIKNAKQLQRELRIFEDGFPSLSPALMEQAQKAITRELAQTEEGRLPALPPGTAEAAEDILAQHPDWGAGMLALALCDRGIFTGVSTLHRWLLSRPR